MFSRVSPTSMAGRVISRALPSVTNLPPRPSLPRLFVVTASYSVASSLFGSSRFSIGNDSCGLRGKNVIVSARREYRRSRIRRASAAAKKAKEKDLELRVKIGIEEQLPEDPEILDIAEMMRLNVPMAMKLALERLNDTSYKTRETAINDLSGFESVELSVLLCNDEFIRKLNKDWRNEDHATEVLSMSQHIPEVKFHILMLGDIVISVETAARQAEERGHSLIDEIRILVVHGLLHLLGFDHELSDEAEREMENEEEMMLKGLGWKGKGLIQSVCESGDNGIPHGDYTDGRKKAASDFTDQNSVTSFATWMVPCSTAKVNFPWQLWKL